MNITLAELKTIFQSALDEPVEINIDTKRDELESWDSINHLNLIVELEEKLNVSFSKDEIEKLNSVKELIDILATK